MLPSRFEGMLKPDYIIPFKKTKEDAKAALKAFCEDKWLLPSLFKSQNRIEAIQAIYVPFWLFDSEVNAYAHFRAEKVHIYESSDEEVTETSHYECLRSGNMAFARIPVDGDVKKQAGAVAYCMAPVWIVTTRYQDKPYTFMMNGQSGKVVGSLPYDMKKAVAYGLLAFAIILPIVYFAAKWLLAD